MQKKYLFIGAHPDDIEIGCAGTIKKLLVEENHLCQFLIVTNGDQGSSTVDPAALAKTRKNEAIQAANVLGVNTVDFLDFADGLTHYTLPEKLLVIQKIREIKPHTVFVHASCDHHPDHKIVHDLVINAISAAAGPWFPKAKGAPHKVAEIYGFEVWNPINQPGLYQDITPYLNDKIKALSEHKSQISNYPYVNAVEGLAKYRGAIAGGQAAEVFEVIRTEL